VLPVLVEHEPAAAGVAVLERAVCADGCVVLVPVVVHETVAADVCGAVVLRREGGGAGYVVLVTAALNKNIIIAEECCFLNSN
jgi:hypothetical protein